MWVDILRDQSGGRRARFHEILDGQETLLSRLTELELLQGCKGETDWNKLASYLDTQDYLDPSPGCWRRAARLYFELRRKGTTVGSAVDCLVAQTAIEHGVLLLHRDRDFEAVAAISRLEQLYIDW